MRGTVACHPPSSCGGVVEVAYLSLDDAVGDAHLAAQSGQPDDEFDGGHVVRDHHEGSLLLLDKGGHVLKPELDHL